MIRMDTMMKKLGILTLALLLGVCSLGNHSAIAQTNAELTTAIAGGAGDIRNFFNTYSGNGSGLAGLDPSLVQSALDSSVGGIENITTQLNDGELESFLSELGDIGTIESADLAGGLLYGISSLDPTQGSTLTSALGFDFFDDLENLIPGITDLLNTELSSILGLAGDLSSLISTISSLFGGGGAGGILGTLLAGGGTGTIGSLLGGGGSSSALPTASPMSPTCDTDIMIAMETRAWLEAQREITQNQNLIAKPDSVMEYTCFDSFLNVLAEQAENMFSENTSVWSGGSVGLITNNDMDNALNQLIGSSMNAYITNNFYHSFLGSRGSDDYTPSTISGAAYTCDRMNAVWMNAKCLNFATFPEDGFLTFDQHASIDPRRFPLDASGNPQSCAGDPKWSPYIDAAITSPVWKATFDTAVDTAYTTAASYTEAGPSACSNSRTIRTGLVIYDRGQKYADAVCINPGCYYVPVTMPAGGTATPPVGTCSPY